MVSGTFAIGCMRLSTDQLSAAEGTAVIHAALDAGVRLLDTADVYGPGPADLGHNERLVAEALACWTGDAKTVEVATKGGLTREGTRWIPDGRARHLRAACERSLAALRVETIDLYQLHAPDPRTPFGTSVRALGRLRAEKLVRGVGLCNVTLPQLREARDELAIASVQIPFVNGCDDAIRSGLIRYCIEHGIRILAYRPFGGSRGSEKRLRHAVLVRLGQKHGSSPASVELAWLRSLAPDLVPLPGPTRVATAATCGPAEAVQLDEEDRAALDGRSPAVTQLRRPRMQRQPKPDADGDVVILMGLQGSGKSTLAGEYTANGYGRLNRDDRGGTLKGLLSELQRMLGSGDRRVVLDNTYATRASRNAVIETAWNYGVPVRCIWIDIDLADAQINVVGRLLDRYGRLPEPDELKRLTRTDPGTFGPRVQLDLHRELEPPSEEEGFATIEILPFVRREPSDEGPGIAFVDYAELIADDGRPRQERSQGLAELVANGMKIVAWGWRPPASERAALETERCAVVEAFAVPIEARWCRHEAGPPVCWCRPPLPGLIVQCLRDHGAAPHRTWILGSSPTAQRLAKACRLRFVDAGTVLDRATE